VYAVIEWKEKKPLILNVHRSKTCTRLLDELSDPEIDRLRAIVRYRERIIEILDGTFSPTPGEKSLIELTPLQEENHFRDEEGFVHIIAPCKDCVSAQ